MPRPSYNLAVVDHFVPNRQCHTCKAEFSNKSMIRLVLAPPTIEPQQKDTYTICVACAQFLSSCITIAMLNIIKLEAR